MLFYWLLSSAFRAQPGRWLIAGLTVSIGIALAVAIQTVNGSALGEFSRALDTVNGQASAQIVMPAGDFSDTLLDEIVARQAALGIRAVSPILDRSVQSLRVLGLDIFQAARVTPALMPALENSPGLTLFSKDAIFLSAAALKKFDVSVGDALTLSIGNRKEIFKVMGLVPGAAGQSLAVMDLGVAQWRLDGLGQLSRLDIQLVDGASLKELATKIESLNLGLTLVTGDDRDRRMSNLSRAYRVNLSVLALVALFTGAFLVFTTISFSVLRQQSQLALLSVLGAKRSWVFGLVLTQALIVAALGGGFGIGLGLFIAAVLLRVVGGDLGGGYFSSSVPTLEIDWLVLLGFWILSLAVGVLAGYFPARAATMGSPVAQLRAGAGERLLKPVLHYRTAIGLAFMSLILAFVPAVGGLPIAAYFSIAFLLFAGLAFTPSLINQIFSFLNRGVQHRRTPSSSWIFAVWRLAQAPASAAGLIAGVVAAVALTVSMVVMVASFRDAVTHWLDQVLPADLYASLSRSDLNPVFSQDPSLTQKIAETPGVARVEFMLQQPLLLKSDRPEVVLIARPVPLARAAQVLPLTGEVFLQSQGSAPLLPEVFVSEAMTDLYGWRPGQVYTLPITRQGGRQIEQPSGQQIDRQIEQQNAPVLVWVAGVFRDYGRQHGSVVMDISAYQALTHDMRQTDIALWLLPSASPSQVLTRLREQFPAFETLQFKSSADLRALSLKIFDRSFALTYALEIAALLVAIFSVAAGFAGQALLRHKEFALMQHLGQSAPQLRQWIIYESGMLLGLAACWGTILGLLMSQILIHRVNPQSFHWTMQTSIPYLSLGVLILCIVLMGMTAAAWASKKNLNTDRLALSLREDW